MLAILSPAKTLDFDTPLPTDESTKPDFLSESKKLVSRLRHLSEDELGALMSISSKLAALNAQRFRDWKPPFTLDNARQALLTFKGDVYNGFELEDWTEKDFRYSQDHLRILSGLYGLLRPLDLIQAYRLEMGTPLENERGKDLYEFWGERLTKALNRAIADSGSNVLVNLASNEYFKAIQPAELEATILTPTFKDYKNGKYRFITIFGKQARGAMADYVVRQRIDDPEELKEFNGMGYRFNEELSEGEKWIFTRQQPERG